MSTPKAVTKVKERRHSVNVTMSVVHKTNRSEDKKLERHVEHLKQKDHADKVRHCTEVRKIEKELESMQIQVQRANRTFTRRETTERDAPYMFGQKIAANQPRKIRRRSHRGDSAAAALNKVASNVDLGGKNRFRSAVMAVCVAKGMGSTNSSPQDQTNEQEPSEGKVISEDKITSGGGGFTTTRTRSRTHPMDRPFTSPVKNSRRSSSFMRPASTSLDSMRTSNQGINPARSAGRRHTVASLVRPQSHTDSPPPPSTLPDLVSAARATIVHAAESAKAASILKRRGSAVSTVTAAERELERRRSSAALRMQEIKTDLTRRDGDLQDRIKLFIKTGMPGESLTKSHRRRLSVLPLEVHSMGSNDSE
ncbi:uncharacterized protein [Asterias amurensis]|uniref:uncharacterized protein n=1 Tax=Asterias amurensis TaxID=7602 RepID=UPI003AB39360